MPGVVVAVPAQGLTYRGVVVVVVFVAPQGLSVGAVPGLPDPAMIPARGAAAGVHGPEARGGQGGEHLRVGGHAGGDVVASSAGSGGDELPGVAGVQV